MRTICQHIFDLARNSINAEAQNIQITVEEDIPNNIFKLIIIDDGRGIKPEILTRKKIPKRCY
jgi:DNA mismatch repair ATPase MutL